MPTDFAVFHDVKVSRGYIVEKNKKGRKMICYALVGWKIRTILFTLI